MSTRQPVSFAARRAFWPSRPIASESWSSGTITVACRSSSSTRTSRTRAGRERLGDEAGGLLVVGNDVDLLAAELGDDHADARAARADAGADRIDAVGVRDDRDLRAEAGLAGDADDLDELVGDLGHLEREQLLDQLRVLARDDDARALAVGVDLGDDGLDPHAVVVALAVDLLGAGQQGLDAIAELDQRVAVVGLLDDPGDQLADAVLELLEHHHPLGLADPLQDDLLGGLGGDPPEVVGGDVVGLDLVLVGGEQLGVELGILGLLELAGLRVDLRLLAPRRPRRAASPRARPGRISSKTRKSAVSRSRSTRAYLAAPGCFL